MDASIYLRLLLIYYCVLLISHLNIIQIEDKFELLFWKFLKKIQISNWIEFPNFYETKRKYVG